MLFIINSINLISEVTTMEEGIMLTDGKVYSIGQLIESNYKDKLHQKYITSMYQYPDHYIEDVEVSQVVNNNYLLIYLIILT